ncbi:transposase [Asaia astilbis]|uniref:transposase n=1 Tax=Asaia astilbis TaxID=610244 RepID=UPI003570F41E
MYKQLTSEQRSQIFALLQRKSPRKEIAHIVGISQSTLSRELKRNSSPSGKYVWFKAHDKAMERRKRSTSNVALAPELVWRIKQIIIEEQWSPRQISGVLKKRALTCRIKASTISYMPIRPGNWRAIHAISSNTGIDRAQGFSHCRQNRYSSTSQRSKRKTIWGFRDGSDSRPLQPRYPHHRGAFHQHALHDEAAAWEKSEPLAKEVRRLLLPYR